MTLDKDGRDVVFSSDLYRMHSGDFISQSFGPLGQGVSVHLDQAQQDYSNKEETFPQLEVHTGHFRDGVLIRGLKQRGQVVEVGSFSRLGETRTGLDRDSFRVRKTSSPSTGAHGYIVIDARTGALILRDEGDDDEAEKWAFSKAKTQPRSTSAAVATADTANKERPADEALSPGRWTTRGRAWERTWSSRARRADASKNVLSLQMVHHQLPSCSTRRSRSEQGACAGSPQNVVPPPDAGSLDQIMQEVINRKTVSRDEAAAEGEDHDQHVLFEIALQPWCRGFLGNDLHLLLHREFGDVLGKRVALPADEAARERMLRIFLCEDGRYSRGAPGIHYLEELRSESDDLVVAAGVKKGQEGGRTPPCSPEASNTSSGEGISRENSA
ncbi:unnamed protein product, partial [Amoebophrya sp. A120]|eukprot:GSA120T00015221001.1